MRSAAILPLLLLAACGPSASVDETNASVEEVSESVRQAAKEEGLIRPGKWVSTVTVEEMSIPGMPPETRERMQEMLSQTRTAATCLTEEDAKKPSADFFSGGDQCRYDHFTMRGGKIDAAMRCSQEGATQVMQMTGTYSGNSYEMRMRSTTEGGPGDAPMTMQMKVESRRVGACDQKQS